MIENLHFLNKDFLWPVVISGLLLWLLFIWKEWSSVSKSKFYLHVLVALIALVSLVMIALKPMISGEGDTSRGVLLTEGFQKERLDSLKQEYKNIKVIPYEVNRPMKRVLDSISNLYVLGNGVKSFDFWQLEKIPVDYLADETPKGIVKLNYQKELIVSDKLVVRGRYSASQEGHRLLLTDASRKEIDSVLMKKEEYFDFELSADIKVKGNYVFKIVEKDSLGNTIIEEPLPLKVLPRENMQVLMVNSFPTFESKYLKNFLAEIGHELTVRSQLTRGKFKFEYFNTERNPFYSFSKKQLERIDLMIIDANSYANLSKKSIQIIEETIQQKGLGVFILPDANFFRVPMKASNFEFLRLKNTKVELKTWPRISWEKYGYSFKDTPRLEKIHDSGESIFTAYLRNGRGRIGTTVIQNSYQVLLNGNSDAYTSFWSKAIENVSKRRVLNAAWNAGSQFAFINEPFSFALRTSNDNLEVFGEQGKTPLMQDPDIAELWSGTTYPRNTGWKSLELKNDSTEMLDFYVMDSTEWSSLTAFNTITKNRRQFNSIARETTTKEVLKPINQLWFYLVFILSMGYLWFAPKLLQN